MIYFIHGKMSDVCTAGTKFENDISKIFRGYDAVEMQYGLNIGSKFDRMMSYLKCFYTMVMHIKRKSVIFFCLPFRGKYYYFFRFISKIKFCRTYGIVIDIDALRNSSLDLQKEITQMLFMDGIIAQNEMQHGIIEQYGYKKRIVELEILDFLGKPQIRTRKNSREFSVCYGGNLLTEQSGFIYEMEQNHITNRTYYIYGINQQKCFDSNNFMYKGYFDTETILDKLEGDFGLVWNGDCLDISITEKGNYYKYASPHKLSMYLMAGMPVIVWDKSAMAGFVKKNKIGISVETLLEIDNILNHLNVKEYNMMLYNVQKIQERIGRGEYLRNCISKVLI